MLLLLRRYAFDVFFWLATLGLLAWATSPSWAVLIPSGSATIPTCTVQQLKDQTCGTACNTDTQDFLVRVMDAAHGGDCDTTGGGTAKNICRCDGAGWVPAGFSGGRPGELVVAAQDSSVQWRAAADYVCPSGDCAATMQAAVDEAFTRGTQHTGIAADGTKVVWSSGTIDIQTGVRLYETATDDAPIAFAGQGTLQTLLQQTFPTTCNGGNGCPMFYYDTLVDLPAGNSPGWMFMDFYANGCRTQGCTAGTFLTTTNRSDPGEDMWDGRFDRISIFNMPTAAVEITNCWGWEFHQDVWEFNGKGVWIHEPRGTVTAISATGNNLITTGQPHGFDAGDFVVVSGGADFQTGSCAPTPCTDLQELGLTVASAPTPTTFTITDSITQVLTGTGTWHRFQGAGSDCQFVSNKIMSNIGRDVHIENAQLTKWIGNAFGHSGGVARVGPFVEVERKGVIEARNNTFVGNTVNIVGAVHDGLEAAFRDGGTNTSFVANSIECDFTITDTNPVKALYHFTPFSTNAILSDASYQIDQPQDCPVKVLDQGVATRQSGVDGEPMLAYDAPEASGRQRIEWDPVRGSAVWVAAEGVQRYSRNWLAAPECEAAWLVADSTTPFANECTTKTGDDLNAVNGPTCSAGNAFPPGSPTGVQCDLVAASSHYLTTGPPFTNGIEGQPRSIGCWFHRDDAGQDDYLIFHDGVFNNGYSIVAKVNGALQWWSGAGQLTSGLHESTAAGTMPTATDVHIAATFDTNRGGEGRLYVNGKNVCVDPLRCERDSSGPDDPLDSSDDGASAQFRITNLGLLFDGRVGECFNLSTALPQELIAGIVRCGLDGETPDRLALGWDADMGGLRCRYEPAPKFTTLPACGIGSPYDGVTLWDSDGGTLCTCDGTAGAWEAHTTGTCL